MTDPKHDANPPGDDLERDLSALGDVEREMLRDARTRDVAPGIERVEASLRAAMRESDASRAHPSRRRVFGIAALIAASIAILAVRRYTTRDSPIPEQPLGNRIEILEPAPGTDPFAQVRWKYPDVPGVRFEVRVFAVGDDTTANDKARFRRSELRERVFEFPNAESTRWPDQIIIVVGVLDADGAFSSSSQVLRSRH